VNGVRGDDRHAPPTSERAMTQHELIAMFRQVAAEVDKRPYDRVAPDSVLSELGIDSLSMMQIVGELESRLNISIPDEALAELLTVSDLVEVVENRLAR
jgi:acyl carrier protein